MILAQAWRRQLWRGLGAALVVPGALFAALVVLALAGGFGGLGVLAQAFSGPAIPAESPAGSPQPRLGVATPGALLAALQVPARGPHSVPVATGPGGSAVPSQQVSAPAAGSGSGGAPTRTRPPGHGVAPSSPSAPPPSPGQPTPTATDEVIGTATGVTSQLPGPVGSAATQALQAAGSAIDQVLPLPGPGQSKASAAPQLP